ncbi:MAG: hypothetical protein PVI11_08900 [Candidatus Aminicenantes bacterium]|jgi:hypothetical protein
MKSKKIFAVLVIFMMAFLDGCVKKADFPDELIGTWKRTDSQYERAFFELTQEKIIFGTLSGEVNAHTIKKINQEKVPDTAEILYTVTYVNIEGKEFKFPFYFNPENGGTVRFQNQPEVIWIKAKN